MITHWRDEEIELAIEGYRNGLSFNEIATDVNTKFNTGRTRASIGGVLHRLGLTGKRDLSQAQKASGHRSTNVRQDGKRRTPSVVNLQPDADTVAALAATDDKPNETSQPILVMRDGKLHANDALSENSCRWPIGDPLARDFCFCGQDTIPMQSYCQDHYRRVYTPVQPVKAKVIANENVKVEA